MCIALRILSLRYTNALNGFRENVYEFPFILTWMNNNELIEIEDKIFRKFHSKFSNTIYSSYGNGDLDDLLITEMFNDFFFFIEVSNIARIVECYLLYLQTIVTTLFHFVHF